MKTALLYGLGYFTIGFFFSILVQVIHGHEDNHDDITSTIIFWPWGVLLWIVAGASRRIYLALFGKKKA